MPRKFILQEIYQPLSLHSNFIIRKIMRTEFLKRTLVAALLVMAGFIITTKTFGQDVCWYLLDEKVCYEVYETKMLVKSEKLDATDIKNSLQNTVYGNLEQVLELGLGVFYVEMQNTSKEKMLELRRQWSEKEDVIWTSPVFGKYVGEMGYANEVVVMLKSNDDYPVLKQFADDYQIVNMKYEDLSSAYILTLPHNPEKDAVKIANELHETGLFVYANPNILWIQPLAVGPPSGSDIIQERTMVLYPNPVNDILYVTVNAKNNPSSCTILLYNTQGNIILRTKAENSTVQLNVSNFPDGIYFLHLYDGNSATPETFKVLIKH